MRDCDRSPTQRCRVEDTSNDEKAAVAGIPAAGLIPKID